MAMTLDGTSGITQMTGSIVMSGSTSGTTTIIPSAVAGTTTVTMPAATGTMMVSGNMPAFSAYLSSTQTITGGAFTKLTCQTKEFDTNSCYDNTTNYRFTPTIAGYYQFSAAMQVGSSASTSLVTFYKNGSEFKRASYLSGSSVSNSNGGTALIYCNGTTDYVEAYILLGTGQSLTASASGTWFQGVMIRNA